MFISQLITSQEWVIKPAFSILNATYVAFNFKIFILTLWWLIDTKEGIL